MLLQVEGATHVVPLVYSMKADLSASNGSPLISGRSSDSDGLVKSSPMTTTSSTLLQARCQPQWCVAC